MDIILPFGLQKSRHGVKYGNQVVRSAISRDELAEIAKQQFGESRWQSLPLAEQLANVGSDVARAHRWQEKDLQFCEKAFVRA